MDCRCRKLSLSFRQFLSAVGVLEQDCRYIFSNFEAMSPVAKTPWKASMLGCVPEKRFENWGWHMGLSSFFDNSGNQNFHTICCWRVLEIDIQQCCCYGDFSM